jgi:hypothetical protein
VAGIVLSFCVGILLYFAIMRPRLAFTVHNGSLLVENLGKTSAAVHQVDVFFYHSEQIFFIENMPDIRQIIMPGNTPSPFQIPVIRYPLDRDQKKEPTYMKMSIRYYIPGIPVFRYTTLLYLKYNREQALWNLVKLIPGKYRALGKAVKGDIEFINLDLKTIPHEKSGG